MIRLTSSGRGLVEWFFVLTATAYNLIRIPKILAAIASIRKFGRKTAFFSNLLVDPRRVATSAGAPPRAEPPPGLSAFHRPPHHAK
jgi:hypothetical protein